jgi:hypothetical protein
MSSPQISFSSPLPCSFAHPSSPRSGYTPAVQGLVVKCTIYITEVLGATILLLPPVPLHRLYGGPQPRGVRFIPALVPLKLPLFFAPDCFEEMGDPLRAS